jgi:rhodanese-related sulfurtransferase
MRQLGVFVAVLVVSGLAVAAAPMINVDDAVFEVTTEEGAVVTHSFVLTNIGDQTLTITRVSTSCGCTTAALARQAIGPGESVSVDATVNTTGFRGLVTRTITVESNDPTTPAAVLQIEVTIPDSVQPAVQEISVGDLALEFYFLIDVRTPDEYAAGHLFGAMNIPLSEFQTNLPVWLPRLPAEVPLILYCLGGVRSLQAATILVEAGVTNVRNLTGGITEWERQLGTGFWFAL